jgi:hypothetical protein
MGMIFGTLNVRNLRRLVSLESVTKELLKYEGESVNRSQMDIKHKTCNIRTWKKHLFLTISSANIDTLVPLLHQCFETHSAEVLTVVLDTSEPPFQPHCHQ